MSAMGTVQPSKRLTSQVCRGEEGPQETLGVKMYEATEQSMRSGPALWPLKLSNFNFKNILFSFGSVGGHMCQASILLLIYTSTIHILFLVLREKMIYYPKL